MDISAEQSRRARMGGWMLTAFALSMFLALGLGPLLLAAIVFARQNPLSQALGTVVAP
ncbi:MAG: hypothetical protein MUF01_15860 [Bryobacterales bacterium]|nr:hypothetical protein [Bryobacterales bacterium]